MLGLLVFVESGHLEDVKLQTRFFIIFSSYFKNVKDGLQITSSWLAREGKQRPGISRCVVFSILFGVIKDNEALQR